MNKPVDLIVANVMHEAVAQSAMVDQVSAYAKRVSPGTSIKLIEEALGEAIARQLLKRISDGANLAIVYKALQAVGAPSSEDMIREGLQAIKDRQTA